MDIISMQIANKVLKRMNQEFNGAYDISIATDGQTDFTTTKSHDITNHGLHVYVDGYHAVEGQDYTHKDQYTVVFKNPLHAGSIVLMSTQIVGVPKFEVTNPAYDDTKVTEDIAELSSRVQSILDALDDDSDGSIVDTIENLKALWGAADDGLKVLVDAKADIGDLQALDTEIKASVDKVSQLEGKVKDIEASMPPSYDDTLVKKDIADIKKDIALLKSKTINDMTMVDGTSNRVYKLFLNDGVLTPVINQTNSTIEQKSYDVTAGEQVDFVVNITANDDAGELVLVYFTKPSDAVIYSHDADTDTWVPLSEEFYTPVDGGFQMTTSQMSFKASFETSGAKTVLALLKKADNQFELTRGELIFNVAEKPVEPPVEGGEE